jgi:hypothetical protein
MRRKASLSLAKFAGRLPSVGFYTQTAEQGTSHGFAAESSQYGRSKIWNGLARTFGSCALHANAPGRLLKGFSGVRSTRSGAARAKAPGWAKRTWRNGRRKGLKIPRLRSYGFDSRRPHHLIRQTSLDHGDKMRAR